MASTVPVCRLASQGWHPVTGRGHAPQEGDADERSNVAPAGHSQERP